MLKDALSQMTNVFLPDSLIRGQEYQQHGFVLNIRLSDGLLKARVKGQSGRIYDVHIDLKCWPKKPAHCTCQDTINCKHAVASLFALQVKENITFKNQPENQLLVSWLQTLEKNRLHNLKNTSKNPVTHHVIYLLEPSLERHDHQILVSLALAKRLKRGGFGRKKIFNSLSDNRKQFFTDIDYDIVKALLFKTEITAWSNQLVLRNSILLEKIVTTGRAYFRENDQSMLTFIPRKAVWNWHLNVDATQQLILLLDDKPVLPLLLDKSCYIDIQKSCLGTLLGIDSLALVKLLINKPIRLEHVVSIITLMHDLIPDFPRPNCYQNRRQQFIIPRPVICFNAIDASPIIKNSLNDPSPNNRFLFIITLFFQYAEIRISPKAYFKSLVYAKNNVLIEVARHFIFEQEKEQECLQLLPTRNLTINEQSIKIPPNSYLLAHYNAQNYLELQDHIVPTLEAGGWLVEFDHPIYEKIMIADELEWFSTLEDRGYDFFSYQLGILVEGRPISIVPLVADLIEKVGHQSLDKLSDDSMIILPLPNGRRLQINMARIKPLLRFLLQYGLPLFDEQYRLKINRYQLLLTQEIEQALIAVTRRWQGLDGLHNQLQKLMSLQGFEQVALPIGLKATLRDYQYDGLNWLQFLRQSQFGGILADDMGLGKTIQTLAHLQVEKEEGRLTQASLIVAPTSLVVNWSKEATRFTPQLKILIFHGLERHQDTFDDYDVVISTYGLIQRDKSQFIVYPFYYLILDEAQFIKNSQAKTTQIIQQIKARHRLCLSGTPLENHLGELWSLFHFLMPGLLGDSKQFRKCFKLPIENDNDIEKRTLLARRVRPFMLRRTKNQVARELPAKTEITRLIELTGTQRDLYEAIRMSMEKKVRDAIARLGVGRSHIVLLDALLKLRQVCCDPKLLSIPEAQIAYGTSAKLAALMTLVDSLVTDNRRVLIFSQFTSMLKIIEEQLISRCYNYLILTGRTQHRQALVDTFQQGQIPIFLISLKAGGTGLNLTCADTVIHYDPWWNPAAEEQATDRSHRIGQKNPVFVYKLIASGTVEAAILTMQGRKKQLFDGILSDNRTTMTRLTTDDITQFFKPLVDEFEITTIK
jgi:hypothetical protein